MYYHLNDHIYITKFQDQFILLDTEKDKYTLCFPELSNVLDMIFGHGEAPSPDQGILEQLRKANIIVERERPFPFSVDKKAKSKGVANVDWRLPLTKNRVTFNVQVMKSLLTLIKVNYYIRFKGFYQTIQLVKKSKNANKNYIIPTHSELDELAQTVNQACLIYPSRTKCLEWALTFVLLALKKGWKCNLEIGVQTYPFMAHAWVECNDQVVMDSQDLREGLGIILNEPFRRSSK